MKRTLVLGASLKPNRYGNLVIHRLVGSGIKTEAIGSKTGIIQGVKVKTNFEDYQNIHTITLYLNSQNQKGYYDAIIGLRPRRVIFNPGTENPEFQNLLVSKGIEVQVACTLVLLATGQY